MEPIRRLIRLGIPYDCAEDVVRWYMTRNDEEGLENYIENIKARRTEVSFR